MQLATGSYVGNGKSNRWINDAGFQPDMVIVKANTSTYAIWATGTMAAGESAAFASSVANFTNCIKSFGASGFQIGTDTKVNQKNINYYWAAFRDNGAGDFTEGSYVGDGADDRNLDIVGFQPTILWIKKDGPGVAARWRTNDIAGDDTMRFGPWANLGNCIQTFRPAGFQVGSDSAVNQNGVTYYYAAFMDAAGYIDTGTYTGNKTDDRAIAVGFRPDVVFVKGDTPEDGVIWIEGMPTGKSGPFPVTGLLVDLVQEPLANGFEVGKNDRVNAGSVDYYWAAWQAGNSDITTTTTSSTTTTTTTTTSTTVTTTTLQCPLPPPKCIPVLEIADEDTTVNLVQIGKHTGFHLRNWTPKAADYKTGGVWQDSPIAHGRRLATRYFGNVVETFQLALLGSDVNILSRQSQDLRRLVEKASDYWTADWQNDPVWLRAKGKGETNPRYALLHQAEIPDDSNPFAQPVASKLDPLMDNLSLVAERGHWHSEAPGCYAALEAFASQSYDGRSLGNVDDTGADDPTANCHVFVANKHTRANLSDVYWWSAANGWSANLMDAALPFDLLDDGGVAPQVNDYVIFGCDTALANSGPFCSLVLDIATGATVTGVWEFSDDLGAWTAFDPDDYRDETDGFQNTGVNSVHWDPTTPNSTPRVWTALATGPGATTALWVRFRITAVGTGIVPAQQNRDVYSAVTPYIEVDSADVGGDLPALFLAKLRGVSCFFVDWLIAGLRSKGRGDDFTAYVNLADEQNPTGIAVTCSGNCAFANSLSAPSGREVTYTAGGDGEITIELGSAICSQYYGVYHAYVRAWQDGGDVGDVTFSLTVKLGTGEVIQTELTDFEIVPDEDWYRVDLGRLEISPPSFLDDVESYNQNQIVIDVSGSETTHFYDLILIPVDEWAGEFVDPEQGGTGTGNQLKPRRLLEIDGVKHPKQFLRPILYSVNSQRIVGHWDRRFNGPPILQANADQRLWFLAGLDTQSEPHVAFATCLGIVQRYLSYRGDR
jgi:hypothetical protein